MVKGSAAVNNPVIADNVAATLGIIGSILIDPQFCRIAAFTLQQTAHNGVTRVLPWMGVKRIEAGRVFAWSRAMVVKANELFDIRRLLRQGTILRSTRFCTSDATFLGRMNDFWFDGESGAITRYQVTGGPLIDAKTKVGYLPAMIDTRLDKETNTAYLPLDYQKLKRLIENTS